MRIELRIDRLVADGLDGRSADDLVAALVGELRLVLAREIGSRRLAGGQAVWVPRLRAALTLPPAGPGTGAGVGAASAGRALGAALGGAVTGDQVFRRGSSR
jgi:hypothetical protein